MQRIYIDRDNATITRRDGDYRLDVRLENGDFFEEVEARCLFPSHEPNKYIALLDQQGKEIAIVRDLNTLEAKSADAVRKSLEEFYLIPRITKIVHFESKPGGFYVTAETDHGICQFKILNRHQSVKRVSDIRAFVCDTNDNRYEIADCRALDKQSLTYLLL